MRPICALAALLALAPAARAEVTRFDIQADTPTALEGRSFGTRGTARRIDARATVAVDPADPRNAIIADIDRAPRNAQGRVEAVADVTILRPERPNGTLVLEIPNRGRRLILTLLEETSAEQSARVQQAADMGRGFLLSQGYTLVWVGWQGDVTPAQGLGLRVPVVPGITGPSRDEWIIPDGSGPVRQRLAYPVADPASLRLTVRGRPEAPRATPDGLAVRLIDDSTIEITRPAAPQGPRPIYELTYTARDPAVMGMAFAALRDVGAFLRRDTSPANPLAANGRSGTDRAIGFGISQSGRVLRDFLYLGFNEDEAGRMVFDGMLAEIPGARRSFTNTRFGQPGRNPGPSEDRGYPIDQFPFTYATTTDPATGRRDGLMQRCRLNGTCPRIMQVDSEFELWASHGSLLVTDAEGRHLDLPPDVRGYMISGAPHFADPRAPSRLGPACQMPTSPVSAAAPVRALMVALDRWITDGTEPPASRYPTRASATLAGPEALYPAIPGLRYAGQYVPADRLDYVDAQPRILGQYPLFLPRGDGDGNALGGIRLPIVEAARATYTGWNLRPDGQELCTQIGSAIPFAATRAERLANNDPRRSIEERYPTAEAYVAAVRAAAEALVADRLLLREDAAEMVEEARAGSLARLQ
ncbi:hypothetical protein EOD42_05790 [Rhodovarius crocodyli]|uniref:Alpha/beta hydrolase domain-containing protein n=1 Tax=Rhodovarius crocodyli TaxID=1979269 RepID=A0A437MPM6_9PROT|nr:alpha/beta hydrolase domain-containing protein [Rhodovarius crocodyli]RVT99589.1 hypothetical protein EOD42_05790 [Rhodovarius crocodyli]